MSKAVLVMDMPESCDMCDFADDTQPPRYGERTLYCNAPGIGDDVTDYVTCRPDFCPLRELPESCSGIIRILFFLKSHIFYVPGKIRRRK